MLSKDFFNRDSRIVAKELLGKIIILNGKKARIVETEAYLGEKDNASWASKGENKVSKMMAEKYGKILIYNVHMYKMLNFVTGNIGKKGAVLIRAVEPLNFESRCNGPGLLTLALEIGDEFHGKNIGKEIIVIDDGENDFEIINCNRIGVRENDFEPLRFYVKNNKHISKK